MPGVLFTILHRISQQFLRLVSYIKDWAQKVVILGLFFLLHMIALGKYFGPVPEFFFSFLDIFPILFPHRNLHRVEMAIGPYREILSILSGRLLRPYLALLVGSSDHSRARGWR